MLLQVWANLVKREKSTAQPPHAADQVLDVKLKQDCSVYEPTFLISGLIEDEILQINYCAWSGFFYFVRNAIYRTNNICELVCEMDVLATFKGDILSQTFYIERAASNYNVNIYDPYVAQIANNAQVNETTSDAFPGWFVDGTYLVRVIGNQSSGVSKNGITTYVMDANRLEFFVKAMFTDSNFSILTDEVVKSFFNPFQYVLSVMWFPFATSFFTGGSGQAQNVYVGWFDTKVSAVPVTSLTKGFEISVARPPVAHNDFRDNAANWCTVRLLIPGVGIEYINPIEMGYESLKASYNIDIVTGEITVYLRPNAGGQPLALLGAFSGHLGVPVQIGQLTNNFASAAGNAISALGSLFTGNVGDALGQAVAVTTDLCQPTPSTNGTAGNIAAIKSTGGQLRMSQYIRNGNPPAVNEIGRPVMKADLLSKYQGYVKCAGASSIIKGPLEIKRRVDAYMNGGFYIE